MTAHIQPPLAGGKTGQLHTVESSPEARREFMLAVLRATRKRAELMMAEIDEIGISLKFDLIGAETAAVWADEVGITVLMPTEVNGGLIAIEAVSS